MILGFLILRLVGPGEGPAAESPVPQATPALPTAQPDAAEVRSPAPPASPAPPSPTAEPSPSPEVSQKPPPEGSVVPADINTLAVPQGAARDKDWFSDAVLLGDSRVDGFRMYSGVTQADYIVRTGMSVYEVSEGKQNITVDGAKYSALQILGKKQYAKVYLSMGVNELGYYNPEGYGKAYGKVVDQVRQLQPDAKLYVLTIIPVNAQKCKENKQKDYVNNDMIRQYNAALVEMAKEKEVLLVNAAAALEDETGELPYELASDGVHFKKEGYVLWRDYLLCHTGEEAGGDAPSS